MLRRTMTTVTIQLPTEIERQLRAAAARSGKSIEAYLQELAFQSAQDSTGSQAAREAISVPEKSAEEWITEWRAWVESHPPRTVLADDSREYIYEGRGE